MNYIFSDRISSLKPSAIREILKVTSNSDVIPFACGNPAPESFPINIIRKFTKDILEDSPVQALQYGITEGYAPLIDAVKKRMKDKFNSVRDFDDLMIVSGAQQAIELACKVLCNEGDTIICENPSFIGSLNSFRSFKVNLRGVPVDSDGANIEAMEKALREEKNVKMLYLIPSFQNPTGITMSFEKRKQVYELAKKYGVMILEDSPYIDLRFSGEEVPTIKSLDTEGIVIYVGTFSKILSAGLRVGYGLAPAPVISKMVVAKQGEDVHTNMLSQMLAYRFMTQFDIDSHINKIRDIYRHKSSLMIESMEKYFDKNYKFTRPEGGLFLWCELPENVPMLEYCKKASNAGVSVVPGVAFNARLEDRCNAFRLNYSTPSDEQIIKGIEILGNIR